jgi:hypothetical protein
MAAGVGHPSGWPDLGPVYDPHASPPPNAVVSIVADSSKAKESNMSASIKGAIRATSSFCPSSETLQGVLAELEAAADLVEGQLVNGPDAEIMAAINRSLVEMPALLAGDLEEQRIVLATFWPEDGEEEHFVTLIRKPTGGPRFHDVLAGPFVTKAEAANVRDEVMATGRYLTLADTEGGSHD